METLIQNLNRRRVIPVNTLDTNLKRYMTTLDLILLGVAHIFGMGIFILVGIVAKTLAGPAVCLSIVIAAICALLSALNYMELSSRIPQCGSAYLYVYVIVGEVWATFVGWTMLLEYLTSASTVAAVVSGILDVTFDNVIHNVTVNLLMNGHEWHSPYFVHFPNILGGLCMCIFTCILLCGIGISSKFINIITSCLMGVMLVYFAYSLKYVDVSNWTDYGGFMPTGIRGVIEGASKLFFLFGAFEVVCTASEECKDPIRSVPIALFSCIVIYGTFSIVTSICLTLIVPWPEISELSPIPEAFLRHGDIFPTYLISFGVLLAIFSCTLTSLYGMTRLAYAMAVDNILFSFLSCLSSKQVPVASVLLTGVISTFVAVFLPFESLVDLLNIGSITSYIATAAVLIVLRYRPAEENNMFFTIEQEQNDYRNNEEPSIGGTLKTQFEFIHFLKNKKPGRVVVVCLATFITCSLCFLIVLFKLQEHLSDITSLILILVFSVIAVLSVGVLLIHNQNLDYPPFKVPFVPFLPLLSILCNLALLVNLPSESWYRFLIWLLAGLIVYFSYGYHHSKAAEASVQSSNPNLDSEPLLKDGDENSDFGSTKMVILKSKETISHNE